MIYNSKYTLSISLESYIRFDRYVIAPWLPVHSNSGWMHRCLHTPLTTSLLLIYYQYLSK